MFPGSLTKTLWEKAWRGNVTLLLVRNQSASNSSTFSTWYSISGRLCTSPSKLFATFASASVYARKKIWKKYQLPKTTYFWIKGSRSFSATWTSQPFSRCFMVSVSWKRHCLQRMSAICSSTSVPMRSRALLMQPVMIRIRLATQPTWTYSAKIFAKGTRWASRIDRTYDRSYSALRRGNWTTENWGFSRLFAHTTLQCSSTRQNVERLFRRKRASLRRR